jgi:hypothetical protein
LYTISPINNVGVSEQIGKIQPEAKQAVALSTYDVDVKNQL